MMVSGGLAVITIPFAYNLVSANNAPTPSHPDTTSNVLSSSTPDDSSASQSPQPDTSDSTATGQAQSQSSTQTSVTVNGQSIDVPANGQVHQTITDSNGQTKVDINAQHQSSAVSGSAHSTSTLNVSTHTQSSSANDTQEDQ